MTPKQFLEQKSTKLERLAGTRGIIEKRERLQKLIRYHAQYTGRMYPINYHLAEKKRVEDKLYTEYCRTKKLAAINDPLTWRRGKYGEFIMGKGLPTYGRFEQLYIDRYNKLLQAEKSILNDLRKNADEHGWMERRSWEKGRGEELSIDLYGADFDKNLYVVQVRQASRARTSYWLEVRKSYFLIGRNENGLAFAHCINGAGVRAAIRQETEAKPETAVNAALKWIWSTDRYTEIVRQGDIGLLPVKLKPAIKPIGAHVIMVVDAHQLWSGEIRKNGKLFAKNPYLHHVKKQHPDVKCNGWYQVIVGKRELPWSFAPATKD